mgnify:FL=1
MGELMGIRPIITLIDGKTRVESKEFKELELTMSRTTN